MKKILVTLVLISIFQSNSISQEVKVIKFSDLEILMEEKHQEIRIINFWATWCKPCVMEMPYFEALNQNPDYPDVTVKFVSLDFVENLESKVEMFIDKKSIKSEVFLLDDIDYNSWIDKVDKSWSGAIPATLIIHGKSGKRRFYEREFKEGDLEKVLNEFDASL